MNAILFKNLVKYINGKLCLILRLQCCALHQGERSDCEFELDCYRPTRLKRQTSCIQANVRRTENELRPKYFYGVSKIFSLFGRRFDDSVYSLRYRWAPEPKILDRLLLEGLAELLAPGVTTGKANGVPETLWLNSVGVAGLTDA